MLLADGFLLLLPRCQELSIDVVRSTEECPSWNRVFVSVATGIFLLTAVVFLLGTQGEVASGSHCWTEDLGRGSVALYGARSLMDLVIPRLVLVLVSPSSYPRVPAQNVSSVGKFFETAFTPNKCL